MFLSLTEMLTALAALGAVLVHMRRSPPGQVLRYFTVQSTLFSAAALLCAAVSGLLGRPSAAADLWLFAGTVSVTVTLLTVLFFLIPQYGVKALYTGPDLFLHLLCPAAALISFAFRPRIAAPSAFAAIGVLPVLAYAALYRRKVVVTEEWNDFYGFNRGGKWKLSLAVMTVCTALLSAAIWNL